MKFGRDRIVGCPSCGAPARVFTLRSSNDLGSSWWTDGLYHMPMCWQPPPITRCLACRAYYWLEDARDLGMSRTGSSGTFDFSVFGFEAPAPPPEPPEPSAWQAAPRVSGLGLSGLLEAVDAAPWTSEEREVRLRTLAWQASSHRNRNWRRKKNRQKTPEDRRNMAALFALHRRRIEATRAPESVVVCAELRRQLGDFEAALALLAAATFPEDLAPWAAEVRRRAELRDPPVAAIPRETWPPRGDR